MPEQPAIGAPPSVNVILPPSGVGATVAFSDTALPAGAGFGDAAKGTGYFTVHRGRDVEHADEGRELLGELISTPADEDAAVAAAERAFEANWKLLDGV